MALITTTVYRSEAGVHENPGVEGPYNTHCINPAPTPKKFKEVMISWDAGTSEWLEGPYIPGQSIPALRVENVCNDSFAYISAGFNDFRLEQLCCAPGCAPLVITFDENRPATDFILGFYDTDGNLVAATTTEGGNVQPIELPPGEYRVCLEQLEGEPLRTDVFDDEGLIVAVIAPEEGICNAEIYGQPCGPWTVLPGIG